MGQRQSPFFKGGSISPPFGLRPRAVSDPEGKGRWPACAKPLRRRQGRDFMKLFQSAKALRKFYFIYQTKPALSTCRVISFRVISPNPLFINYRGFDHHPISSQVIGYPITSSPGPERKYQGLQAGGQRSKRPHIACKAPSPPPDPICPLY